MFDFGILDMNWIDTALISNKHEGPQIRLKLSQNQNLIGCSTLSHEYYKLIGWCWLILYGLIFENVKDILF